jgi:hypothetical protein
MLERGTLDRRGALANAPVIFTKGERTAADFGAACSLVFGVRVPLERIRSGFLRRLPDGRVRAAARPGFGAFPATWGIVGDELAARGSR